MTILGHSIQELFLYFLFYSFLGWLMETCYCSLHERRLVPRGFLYGSRSAPSTAVAYC